MQKVRVRTSQVSKDDDFAEDPDGDGRGSNRGRLPRLATEYEADRAACGTMVLTSFRGQPSSQGLMSSMPVSLKSAVLRVARMAPKSRQMAAI